jgi:hypothetical protein
MITTCVGLEILSLQNLIPSQILEPTKFTGGLNVKCERKRKVKDDFTYLA